MKISMKSRFRFEKIMLAVTAMFSLCVFFSYAAYIGQRIFIYASLPEDYEIAAAKITDWEELGSRSDNDGLPFESSFLKYSYRLTYEYTADGTAYILNHDTNYISDSVSDNTEMTVYCEKNNPENIYLLTMRGYTYLFSKNVTFQITYSEHLFDGCYNIVYFLLFLLSIASMAAAAVRVHGIRNGKRKRFTA